MPTRINIIQNTLLIVALLGTSLSACQSPAPTKEPVKITFAIPDRLSVFTPIDFESLAQAFNQANPDIEVQLQTIKESNTMDLYTDVLLNEEWGIDAFFSSSFTSWLAGEDLVLNLQPLLEADPSWELDDFYPPALASFQHANDLWGVPTEFVPMVVFYNQDLFDQAGVPYPQSDWTRDDFLETAVALRTGLSEQVFPFAGMTAAAIPFVYGRGGALVAQKLQCQLDDPLTLQALKWYLNLALEYQVMPTTTQVEAYEPPPDKSGSCRVSTGSGFTEAAQRVLELECQLRLVTGWGGAAMWFAPLGERGDVNRFVSPWDFHWGVTPLPQDVANVTILDSYGCYVTAHSQHPKEALRWIQYLSRQRVYTSGLPARRSLAQSTAFRSVLSENIDDEALDSLLAQVEQAQAVPFPLILAESVGTRCLGGVLIDVYERGEKVETAVMKAQQGFSD